MRINQILLISLIAIFSNHVFANEVVNLFYGTEMRKCKTWADGSKHCFGDFEHAIPVSIKLTQWENAEQISGGEYTQENMIGDTKITSHIGVVKNNSTGEYFIQIALIGNGFLLKAGINVPDIKSFNEIELSDDNLIIKDTDGSEYSPDLYVGPIR